MLSASLVEKKKKIRVLARDRKGSNETTLPLTPEKCILSGGDCVLEAILARQRGDSSRQRYEAD